jgi:hypothetical protein
MQRDLQRLPMASAGPVPLWLLLVIAGVALGSAALVAAVAGSATELAGVHFALQKVSIL